MRLIIVLIGMMLLALEGIAQELYLSRNAVLSFHSRTPVEDIDAKSTTATAVFNRNEGSVAFQVLMKSFMFERAAMQEHFNKDYVESDKFPKAVFEGKIVSPDYAEIKGDGEYKVEVAGDLTIHGVKKPVRETGTIVISGNEIKLESDFKVLLSDYNVKVPTMYIKNISQEINIKVKATLKPYER